METQKTLNLTLFSALALISALALYHQLDDFAHLKNAEGVLTDMRSLVLWEIRVPRIGLAVLTGTCLALAGNAMQGIFQNPLASPGLLGSSAGATAASVLILYYFSVPFTLLLFGGVAGALASFLLVYAIAKNHGTTMMILSGLAVNMLLGAVIAFQRRKPMGIGGTLPLATRLIGVGSIGYPVNFLTNCIGWYGLFVSTASLHRFAHLWRRNRRHHGY